MTLGGGVPPRHERDPQEYPHFCRASLSRLWANRRRTRWCLVPVIAVVLVKAFGNNLEANERKR
jgi:hypothetical protein